MITKKIPAARKFPSIPPITFLMVRPLGNNDGERQKKEDVYISETTTLHVHHAFLHIFLAILERLRHETSYFHAPALRSR